MTPTPRTEAMMGLATTTYHPDREINAGVALDAAQGELVDIRAGLPARRWRCRCGTEHSRGPQPNGGHRCLSCGYIGSEGVLLDAH